MSLCFSHNDLTMSARAFHRLRRRLAADIGLDLDRMEGYDRSGDARPWPESDDPLIAFLKASDADEIFSPTQCLALKRRIRELAEQWASKKDADVKDPALRLAEAMALASTLGEPFHWIG